MEQKSQITLEWEAHDQALIECAQRAWDEDGAGYPLYGWVTHSLTAIVAYGEPPRARDEYQHVFLFEKRAEDGAYHLRTIGKARWDKPLWWWGVCLTAKATFYKCFPIGTWTAARPELATFDAYTGA